MLRALAFAAVLGLAWSPRPVAAADVTIYRCIDAKGRLTLRDTPCAKGEQQQTRTMIRPTDAAPRPAAPRANDADRAPVRDRARVVVAYPPRPLYECMTPDGERYTSESDEGNPRWVPLWTLGFPVVPRDNLLGDRVGAPLPPPPDERGGRRLRPEFVALPGTWVRDECHALPQAETCARMLDRRDEIRRRFFNAMPSERDVLRREERGINARLDSDCDGA